MQMQEIFERVQYAKAKIDTSVYPAEAEYVGEGLIGLMELYNQQQAEIERLRAEMTAIQSLIAYRGTDFIAKVYEIAERNSDIQHQPEPPQESLEIRILRYLAKCTVPKSYAEISEELGLVSFLSDVMSLVKSDYLLRRSSGFQITAAGRDYLASLDKPTIETTEDYLSQLD